MAAARAVFETPELLKNIIIFVPAYKIHSLKKVSRDWRQLIRTSPSIRRARCLKPARYLHEGSIPFYDPGMRLRIHPRIWVTDDSLRYMGELVSLSYLAVDNTAATKLEEFSENYVTAPRCQVLLINLPGRYTNKQVSCILYVKDGIKIKDLLDARNKLLLTYTRYLRPRERYPRRNPKDGLSICVQLAEAGHIGSSST